MSKVIPVTAAYPAVSLVVAAIALAEPIDAERLTGTALIVLGVAILGQP